MGLVVVVAVVGRTLGTASSIDGQVYRIRHPHGYGLILPCWYSLEVDMKTEETPVKRASGRFHHLLLKLSPPRKRRNWTYRRRAVYGNSS